MKPVGLGTKRERTVMGRHDQIGVRQVPPEGGRGKVDGVESAKFSRHRLGRPIEDDRVDLDELERVDQREDRRAASRHLGVGQSGAKAKAIQGVETFDHDEGTGNTTVDLRPLGQCVPLARRHAEEDRHVDVRNYRCP
jgi:hypothetical protein